MINMTWPPILIISIFGVIGAMLPTWMFINSLSLIVHTNLLNTLLPPSVFYVFKKYLYFVRMSWVSVGEYMEESYIAREYVDEPKLYSAFLLSSDYFHLFTHNLFLPMIATALICAVWICTAIFDYFVNRRNR